jgi:predicted RNA-binding Zn ribbon-like protein
MDFAWTPHRFAGGALALDVANSVILRFDPERSIDRFAKAGQMDTFPAAATEFSAERALFGALVPVDPVNHLAFLQQGDGNDRLLAELLEAAAAILRSAGRPSLEAETAHSALRLLANEEIARLKICSNCGWLFIDRSRNRSRLWCDMAVCGNRVKASRHYHRRKEAEL